MKKGRGNKLAAAFVVTVAATGCKKTTVGDPEEPVGTDTAYVQRDGDRCTMSLPEHCPKGAMCNPPPPTEIDCPPSFRDAGEADPAPKRPAGKEDWLRAKPRLFASKSSCGYTAPHFCAPPGKPAKCDRPAPSYVEVKCAPKEAGAPSPNADAGAKRMITLESFVGWNGFECMSYPSFDCEENTDCIKSLPAGTPAACPPK